MECHRVVVYNLWDYNFAPFLTTSSIYFLGMSSIFSQLNIWCYPLVTKLNFNHILTTFTTTHPQFESVGGGQHSELIARH